MSTKRPSRSTPTRSTPRRSGTGAGAGTAVLAFVLGAAVAAAGAWLYLRSSPRPASLTPPPAATPRPAILHAPPAPQPGPQPSATTTRTPPFGTSEDAFEAGAHLYANRCASCHGTPQAEASTHPSAPQLWRKARPPSAATTSPHATSPSDLFSEIAVGAPAKGMPAYARILTDTQIWQIALLLGDAEAELPDPVQRILNTPPSPPGRKVP